MLSAAQAGLLSNNMKKFEQIAVDIFGLKPEDVNDSLTAKEIPGWDSMNYLLFVAELEKQYNTSFSMDEVLGTNTLGEVKAMLQKRDIAL